MRPTLQLCDMWVGSSLLNRPKNQNSPPVYFVLLKPAKTKDSVYFSYAKTMRQINNGPFSDKSCLSKQLRRYSVLRYLAAENYDVGRFIVKKNCLGNDFVGQTLEVTLSFSVYCFRKDSPLAGNYSHASGNIN